MLHLILNSKVRFILLEWRPCTLLVTIVIDLKNTNGF